MKDKFRLVWGQWSEDRARAQAGLFDLTVDYDNDSFWTYTIECGIWTVREFGDYEKSFGTKEQAMDAAEKWLFRVWKRMGGAFKQAPRLVKKIRRPK